MLLEQLLKTGPWYLVTISFDLTNSCRVVKSGGVQPVHTTPTGRLDDRRFYSVTIGKMAVVIRQALWSQS